MGEGASGRAGGLRETPLEALERWVDNGATYRLIELTAERAVVQLCTCYGEPVDRLESDDRDLIAYLRERPSSEPAG